MSGSGGIVDAREIFDAENGHKSPLGWLGWVRMYQQYPRVFVNDVERGICLFAEPVASDGRGPLDTWQVWYASGPVAALFDYIPFPLPYVAWLRRKTMCLHFTRWERIRRLSTMRRSR